MADKIDTYNVKDWIIERARPEEEITTLRADRDAALERVEEMTEAAMAGTQDAEVFASLNNRVAKLEAALAVEHKVSSAMQQQVEAFQKDNAALREWAHNAHEWLIDHRELGLSGKSHWVAGLISTYHAAIDDAGKGWLTENPDPNCPHCCGSGDLVTPEGYDGVCACCYPAADAPVDAEKGEA